MASFKKDAFKQKLAALSESAQSIQTLSHWVCYHKKAVKESAQIWAQEALKAPPERRLLFVYLANDIMQNSRRKGVEFCQAYGAQLINVLPEAYVSAKSETIKTKLLRMLGIWEERRVLEPSVLNQIRLKTTGGSGADAPAGGAAAGGASTGLTLPDYLNFLDEASAVDSLKAEREAALPVAALALGDDSAVSPAQLQKASQLLPQQLTQLKEELASRQKLVLLLANACEKQQALFEKLRGSIDDCTALHAAAQSMSKAAEGGYSPSDP